jgi:hypothetical protein
VLKNLSKESSSYPSVLKGLQDAAAGQGGTASKPGDPRPLGATLLSLIAELGQHHTVVLTALAP